MGCVRRPGRVSLYSLALHATYEPIFNQNLFGNPLKFPLFCQHVWRNNNAVSKDTFSTKLHDDEIESEGQIPRGRGGVGDYRGIDASLQCNYLLSDDTMLRIADVIRLHSRFLLRQLTLRQSVIVK